MMKKYGRRGLPTDSIDVASLPSSGQSVYANYALNKTAMDFPLINEAYKFIGEGNLALREAHELVKAELRGTAPKTVEDVSTTLISSSTPESSPRLSSNENLSCPGGNYIPKNLVSSKYDLSELLQIDNGYYILLGNNIELAKTDILSMNAFIQEARKLYPDFPQNVISKDELRFEYRQGGTRDYCILNFEPLTRTGKPPKYAMQLSFFPSMKLFGRIFYTQKRDIGKVSIISWESQVCYILDLAMVDDTLNINMIYKSLDGRRIKIYDRKV